MVPLAEWWRVGGLRDHFVEPYNPDQVPGFAVKLLQHWMVQTMKALTMFTKTMLMLTEHNAMTRDYSWGYNKFDMSLYKQLNA